MNYLIYKSSTTLILTIIFLFSGLISESHASNKQSFTLTSKWYKIKHKAENDPQFYGRPMSINKIEHTGKKWKCDNKYCYTYRIIINRPSNDRGDGIVRYGTTPFKIEYWIGEAYSQESDILAAIDGGYDISQLKAKRRELILSFNKPFVPGKYRLKIAPFPYPSLEGSSLAKFMNYYRHDLYSVYEAADDYLSYGEALKDVMSGLIVGKIQDVTIDTIMIKVANKYGVYVVVDIPSVMPGVVGMHVKKGHKELVLSSLRPEPKNWECKKTKDRSLFGKIIKAQYSAGKLLPANEKVIYEYYCPGIPMPKIKGMYKVDVDKTLRKLGLRPSAGKCVITYNKNLDKKVFRHQFAVGEELAKNQRVAYKYYCFNKKQKTSITYKECPKRNPGNKDRFTIDINNKANDGTHLRCVYYNHGALKVQSTYIDNKQHGLSSGYLNTFPHDLAYTIEMKNGKKHGLHRKWRTYKNTYYRSSEATYVNGKLKTSTRWNKDGKKTAHKVH